METKIVHHSGTKATFTITTNGVNEFMKLYAALSTEVDPEPKQPKQPRMRNKRTCTLCGKSFKGRIGLGMHTTRAHSGRNWSRIGTPKPASNIIPIKDVV